VSTERILNRLAIANFAYIDSQSQHPPQGKPVPEQAWTNLGILMAKIKKDKEDEAKALQGDQLPVKEL